MSLTLFNQPVKVRFSKIFLLLHNFFDVSSKIGVSKNSKFEFLEPKSTIKGGLRFSFKDRGENQVRKSINVQRQSGSPTKI
uniref:Putative ovule protein n=1 Tax=Solanum chacoense TaxID=4108 RepID=A0A0V0HHF1_SOLCH